MMTSDTAVENVSSPILCECCIESKRPFLRHHLMLMVGIGLIGLAIVVGWFWPKGQWLSIVLYASVLVIHGRQMMLKGLRNLLRVHFDMNTLMTIAVIGGVAIGEWLEVAVIVILFAIGGALERYAVSRAEKAIGKLLDQAPQIALVDTGEGWRTCPVSDIRVGMRVRVRSGAAIPLDGFVLAGESSVVEAMITGEPLPVDKQVGDVLYAGTLNQEGILEFEVTAEQGDTRLARIVELVSRAQAQKSRSETIIARFARVYTPIVIAIALGVMFVPYLVFSQSFYPWFYQGLAVLLIGCPCALVIATPTAVVAAHAKAAQAGVLIKGGAHLEILGRVDAMAFDKTGTLTEGKPIVTSFLMLEKSFDQNTVLRVVAALESRTDHPIAQSLVTYARVQGTDFDSVEVQHFLTRRGAGVEGIIEGHNVEVRKPTKEEEGMIHNHLEQPVGTPVIVLFDERPIASFWLADTMRPDAAVTMQRLEQLGIKTRLILSGDSEQAVNHVARQLEVRGSSRLMPEDKLLAIETLKRDHRSVAMVGDGVNDAPALALADLGIAMGAGASDTALETADVALLSDDLRKLPYAIRLSRRTHRIIFSNILFALGLKLATLSLVIPGLLTLWFAILADVGATLIVVMNSLRLLQTQKHQERWG